MEQVQARTASPKHSRNSKPEQLIQARAASPKQRSKSHHNRSPRQNSQRNFIFSLKQVQAREARPQQSSKSPAAQPVQSQHQSKTGFRVDIFSQEQVPASAASPQQSSNSKPEQQVQARAASPKQSSKSQAPQQVQSEQKSRELSLALSASLGCEYPSSLATAMHVLISVCCRGLHTQQCWDSLL